EAERLAALGPSPPRRFPGTRLTARCSTASLQSLRHAVAVPSTLSVDVAPRSATLRLSIRAARWKDRVTNESVTLRVPASVAHGPSCGRKRHVDAALIALNSR